MTQSAFAPLSQPPYRRVVFVSTRRGRGDAGCAGAARGGDGCGATLSCRDSGAATRAWRRDAGDAATRTPGWRDCRGRYALRVARVARACDWERTSGGEVR